MPLNHSGPSLKRFGILLTFLLSASLVQAQQPAQCARRHRREDGAPARSGSDERVHDPLRLEGPDGLAHGRATDVESVRELAFGQEVVADSEPSLEDLRVHPREDELEGLGLSGTGHGVKHATSARPENRNGQTS